MYRSAIPSTPACALLGLLAVLGLAGAREAAAQNNTVVIPADTVMRLRLDQALSSRTARVGDTFAAVLSAEDTSGFPTGARFQGTITEVRRSTKDSPGILDMEVRRAYFPDGQRVAVQGTLASLADEDVRRTSDGRLEARRRTGSRFDWKWVGYGAAAGAVLGGILGDDWLKGALFGGLGGAVYSYLRRGRGGDSFRDVALERGTEFGVRLDQRVAFADRAAYRYTARRNGLSGDEVLGAREEFRFGSTAVRLNGRAVTFADARPVNLNDTLYVPLRPIAEAANMRFEHQLGDSTFQLWTRSGPVRGSTGEPSVTVRENGRQAVDGVPVSIDGVLYVPTDYLSRVADMRVTWDRRNLRLDLETQR